jgi:mitochondrial fission protein ELM1
MVQEQADACGRRTPRVWVLSGHKAGDNAQLMALAHALGWPFEVKEIAYRRTELATNLLLRVTLAGTVPARSSPLRPPWPDLVLTAGRRNEPVARWIGRQADGRARLVHLGRPWAPPERFDLVVTTPQYFVPERVNVLTVGMPLHAITPATLADAAAAWQLRLAHLPRPRIAVLVGGVSSPYPFGAEEGGALGALVNARALQAGGSLLVTTSARTGREAVAAIEGRLTAPRHVHRWAPAAAENPYRAFLGIADEIVVTGDSISMLAEATATGKPVFIFDLGGMRQQGLRPLSAARDARSLLHLALMRVAPRRMRRDTRILLQAAVAQGRAAWLGDPAPAGGPASAEDLARAAQAVRRLLEGG